MAEISRFFDHIDGDRTYNADEFAEYFRQVLTSGILNGGENLQVYVNGTDRIARIKPGKAWIEGYFYKLTEELELPLDEAHGTYDRIDRIVIRLNTNAESRNIKAYVKTGEPASNPVEPEITREGDIYELSLAQILVLHNTTAIPTENVTDERLDDAVCGLVNSLITIDTKHMQDEFDAFMETLAGQAYVSQEEFDTVTDQLFQSGLSGKTLLEAAIKSKGGTVSKADEVATFDELDAGIESIITDPSGDATAEASDILIGKTAYSQYKKLTGTMPNRGSKTFTPSDSTQSGSAGYYSGITVNPRPALSGTAATSNVLSGKTFYGSSYSKQTGAMTNRGAVSKTITTQGGSYTIPKGYHSGSGSVKAQFANLIASNIKKGINVGGVVGTLVQGIEGESSGTDVLVNIASFDWWDGEEVDSIRRYKKVLKTDVISGKCKVHFQATGNVSSQPGTYLCSCYVYKNNNQIGSTSLYVRDVGADKEKETTYKSIEINLSGSKDDEYEFRMDAEDRPTKAGIELSFKTTGIEIYN